jgi:hypothetical protein
LCFGFYLNNTCLLGRNSGVKMADFGRAKLRDRYMNDSVFHTLVNTLENAIEKHGFTPSELREAVFMAHYKYEMKNPDRVQAQFNLALDQIYRK